MKVHIILLVFLQICFALTSKIDVEELKCLGKQNGVNIQTGYNFWTQFADKVYKNWTALWKNWIHQNKWM